MDQHHVPAWTRSVRSVPTRRDILRGLAGAGIGISTLGLPGIVDAKKHKKTKGKKKRKTQPHPQLPPLVFNQFGCIEVGQPCRGDSALCCSGICQGAAPAAGQPDVSRCVAHGTGTCDQAQPGLCEAANPGQAVCDNSTTCVCLRTTAGSRFCGENSIPVSGCADCQRDKDCEALGFAPGSACAPFAAGSCAGNCASGMVCMAPCGTK